MAKAKTVSGWLCKDDCRFAEVTFWHKGKPHLDELDEWRGRTSSSLPPRLPDRTWPYWSPQEFGRKYDFLEADGKTPAKLNRGDCVEIDLEL